MGRCRGKDAGQDPGHQARGQQDSALRLQQASAACSLGGLSEGPWGGTSKASVGLARGVASADPPEDRPGPGHVVPTHPTNWGLEPYESGVLVEAGLHKLLEGLAVVAL